MADFDENKKNMGGSLDEENFRKLYGYEPPDKKPIGQQFRKNVRCTTETLTRLFPILKWLPRYQKTDLISDVLSGFTVGVMHIPQGMAYALLGCVPPVVGIYMAFFPVLVYILMGTSHHVSMGTFAVVCMMVGKSVDELAAVHTQANDTFLPFHSNLTSTAIYYHGEVPPRPTPVQVATALCLVVGIWQVVLSLLRLGSLSVFLSQTLVSGFTTGAAVHVFTSQVRNMLGITGRRYSGPLKIIYTYIDIFSNLPNLNVVAVVLSLSFIAVLVVFNEFIKPYVQSKTKKMFPFPIELLVVIAGTLLSMYFNVKENYGVAILESVPKGLPNPSVPPLNLVPELLVDGLVIAVVAVSINLSMASIFSQKLGYEIDGNQEILASGVGNIFSSFFSCMPYSASLSRSLVQVSVGGKTLISSAVSAVFLLFILLFVGPYFEPLPYCILSTIIVVALKGMFVQVADLPGIFRKSKLDGLVWLVTFSSVVVLDISYGLGVGLLASVATLIIRGREFQVVSLGRLPNSRTYVDVNLYKRARPMKNTLILRVIGSIHFANCANFKKKVLEEFSNFYSKTIPLTLGKDDDANHKVWKSVVLDLSCVPFLDPSASKALKLVYDELRSRQSDFFISCCQSTVYETLQESDFFLDFPKCLIFHTLDDAANYAENLNFETKDCGNIILKF